MARRPGRSFRKLVKRGTNVRDSLLGKLLSQSKPHRHGHGNPGELGIRRNRDYGSRSNLSESSRGSSSSLRNSLVLEKEDDEIFGFEFVNSDSLLEDLRVHVSCVQPESPAERAGMKPGDILISVNDVSVFEIPHQQITDMIINSGLTVRLETISAVTAKQMELRERLHQLKRQLKEKTTELRLLATREEELTGVKQAESLLGESQMSLSSTIEDDGSSGHSSSIGSRWSICGSLDAGSTFSNFEDLSPIPQPITSGDPSSTQEGCLSLTPLDLSKRVDTSLCAASKEGLVPTDGDHSKLLKKKSSLHRSSSFGTAKQKGLRNRLTSIFSGSRRSLTETGPKEDV